MKYRLIAGAMLAFAFSLNAQEKVEAIDSFANRLDLQTSGTEGMYRVTLPMAVYRGAAHADLRDLRVFNASGERVPFAFASPAVSEVETRVVTTLPMFPLREVNESAAATGGLNLQIRQQSDGTIVSLQTGTASKGSVEKRTGYLLDASKLGKPIQALTFDWQAGANAQSGRVLIEGSDDLKSWRALAEGAPLIDLEFGGQRLQQKRIELRSGSSKYLRVTWEKAVFELTRVDVESVNRSQTRMLQTHVAESTKGEKAGEYLFDLGAKLPVERVRVLLPEANTVAPVQLLVRGDDKSPWRVVAGATFYRLTRDGVELVAPAVMAATYGERYWLVRVDSRSGGIGAGMPRLEVNWSPRDAVFVARGAAPYRLAFGKQDAGNAAFAISALMPGYKIDAEQSLPRATVSDATANVTSAPTVGEASVFAMSKDQGKKTLLWLILIGGVGFLAWMAWRLNRDLNKPKE